MKTSFLNSITPSGVAKVLVYGTALVVVTVAIIIGTALSDGLPTLEQLENPKQDLATQVFSADGVLLEHFATTRRTYTPYDSIPRSFVNALVATEDREFNDHWGVHTMRIVKATVKNVLAMRAREGASTITQQLARNLYFTQEQTVSRKIREAWTALQIERTYTKHEILEMYSNTVYYGKGAYGIRVASQVYFNKEPMKLSIAESAYLVGLFKAPERYGLDDSAGVARRNLILDMMRNEDHITEAQWSKAVNEPLTRATAGTSFRGIAPHFVEMIRQALGKSGDGKDKLKGYDLYRDGLVIHTTLNSQVQKYANQAAAEHLAAYQQMFDKQWSWKGRSSLLTSVLDRAIAKRSDFIGASAERKVEISKRLKQSRAFVDSVKREATTIQMGMVALDPRTGAIIAMVGGSPQAMGRNPAARYSLNHVTQIRRQPGSSFKPFVYASALETGMTPESMVESGPFSFTLPSGEVWAPQGSRKEGGPVSLRTGLKFSTNSVSARLITEHTTPSSVVNMCQRAGITSPLQAVPSIALGSVEVSPMELTSAYGTFLNQGIHVPPVAITRIEDRMGNVLYEAQMPQTISEVMPEGTARDMISMMRGVVDGGTASSVRKFFRYDAAGKTGTTNDFADAWFVGFTPQLVAGTWVGFDDRRVQFTGDYGQGGRAAAPAWARLMQKVYNDPTLAYRQLKFAVAKNPADTLAPGMTSAPPSEQMSDSIPDPAPVPPSKTPIKP